MVTIPTIEPDEFTAGELVEWTKSFSDYPASDGWVLTYAVRGAQEIDIVATADGDAHAVSLTAAATGAYTAGMCWWQSKITKGSEVYILNSGDFEIIASLSAVSGTYDGRTHAAKMVDAIEALLENKATKDQLSYSIQGRSITKLSPEETIKWLNFYRGEVNKQEAAQRLKLGLGSNQSVMVRM